MRYILLFLQNMSLKTYSYSPFLLFLKPFHMIQFVRFLSFFWVFWIPFQAYSQEGNPTGKEHLQHFHQKLKENNRVASKTKKILVSHHQKVQKLANNSSLTEHEKHKKLTQLKLKRDQSLKKTLGLIKPIAPPKPHIAPTKPVTTPIKPPVAPVKPPATPVNPALKTIKPPIIPAKPINTPIKPVAPPAKSSLPPAPPIKKKV